MEKNGFLFCIHHKNPKGRQMPERTRIGYRHKSQICTREVHVLGEQNSRMGLIVRTNSLTKASTINGIVNIVIKLKRLNSLRQVNSA
jgi:hypothetical protein